MNQLLIQQYYLKLFSTLSLAIAFFLIGLTIHYFGFAIDLKISILVLVSFILIFLHRKPCFFQLICLLCMSFIQGVLVSACFIKERNIPEANLIKGFLCTLAIITSIFALTYYSDTSFKQNIGKSCEYLFYSILCFILISRVFDFAFTLLFYQKIIFILMLNMFIMSLRQIYCHEDIKNRNYILDSLVLGFCILQVLIKLLIFIQ